LLTRRGCESGYVQPGQRHGTGKSRTVAQLHWGQVGGVPFVGVGGGQEPGHRRGACAGAISTKEEVDECEAAKRAFPEWRATPAVERCRYLFRLKHLLEERQADLARVITLEHGKEYRAAYGEMRRLIEMMEVACGIPTLMMGDYSEQIVPRIEEYSIRVPLGVFAMIPPFNFPGMIPFWFMPWAVALGDTYIIKPNRQCPMTQRRLFELIDEVGLPPGVVNLVTGGRGSPRAGQGRVGLLRGSEGGHRAPVPGEGSAGRAVVLRLPPASGGLPRGRILGRGWFKSVATQRSLRGISVSRRTESAALGMLTVVAGVT